MKKIYVVSFTLISLFCQAQIMTFSATPDSASQTPRPGSTGTFSIAYSNSVCTNDFYYSICCANSISSALNLYRFNINIPLSASITGVSASYSTSGGNGGPTNYKWDSLSLAYNFSQIGTYKRDSINGAGGTFTHGNSSDLWGAALTPSMVNSPLFGLIFHIDTYGINTTVLGGFNITIHYTLPSGLNESKIYGSDAHAFVSGRKLFVKKVSGVSAVELYDLSGKRVLQERLSETSADGIDLKDISPGIYAYRLSDGINVKCAKLLVE